MKQLILYGRGGQGVVTAAKLICTAAGVYEGVYAQAIPAFTAERRGAPVYAYVRLSDAPIDLKSFVYEPDAILVFDPELPSLGVNLLSGVNPATMAVVNSAHPPADWDLHSHFAKVGAVDAHRLGPVPNSAMIGAFCATTGWLSIDAATRAIKDYFGARGGDANAGYAKQAFAATRLA